MIYTTTRPGNGDIVLGVAGRSTKVVLDTTNKDENKTATQIVADFISAKKWGYNTPNYRVDGNKIFVSKWAVGQVVGSNGYIVKAIKKMYGFVKVEAMSYEEDSQYVFIDKFIRLATDIVELERPGSWFWEKWDKCSSGMYTRYVCCKTGSSYADSEINLNQELCEELERLGGSVKSPILGHDTDTNTKGLYMYELRGMSTIYCLEKDLELLKFFGYNKKSFKKYDKVALTKEKIEEFLERIEGGDFYRAPANNLFYSLQEQGVKFLKEHSFTDKELVEATRGWMKSNCSTEEIEAFENKVKEREERIRISTEEFAKAFVEFEKLNKERVELGMSELTLSSTRKFNLGFSYKLTIDSLKLIKEDIDKQKKKIEKKQLEEKLLAELDEIIKTREENGLGYVGKREWGGFLFNEREYFISEETLKILKEDTEKKLEEKKRREQEEIKRETEEREKQEKKPSVNKKEKKKEEGFDNPFADFFGG